MASPARKAASRKTSKAPVRRASAPKAATAPLAEQLNDLIPGLTSVLERHGEDLTGLTKAGRFTQGMQQVSWLIRTRLKKLVDTADKLADSTILHHRDEKGPFAQPRAMGDLPGVLITFKETERKSPQWKELAVEQAALVAELRGVPFDRKRFLDRILDGVTPKTSVKPQLTESV